MPSLEMYKRIHSRMGNTIGQVHKVQSDLIMNKTWFNDVQAKVVYLYDYKHDDEPLKNYHLDSTHSISKTPIDIKFIVNSYNSENKDQVGYHIQFRPGQECPLNYYHDEFEKKYSSEFPIGLYCDIPDEKGIYRKWLITENANWLDNQFPTYYVLPIDHLFQWVYKQQKYQMWGVGRSQNSYNKICCAIQKCVDENWVKSVKVLSRKYRGKRIDSERLYAL